MWYELPGQHTLIERTLRMMTSLFIKSKLGSTINISMLTHHKNRITLVSTH
jgi:hypothetical protein